MPALPVELPPILVDVILLVGFALLIAALAWRLVTLPFERRRGKLRRAGYLSAYLLAFRAPDYLALYAAAGVHAPAMVVNAHGFPEAMLLRWVFVALALGIVHSWLSRR